MGGPGRDDIVGRAGALAREVLAPLVVAGEPGRVNRPLVLALAEVGLLTELFPGDPPGPAPAAVLCALREGLARECPEAETALALQGLGGYPILEAGSPGVRARFIPGIAAGGLVAAFALSEAGAGSDAAALSLAAGPDGRGWRLSGEKAWISNAPDADVYTVFARTGGAGPGGVTAFAVPGGAEGLSGERVAMLAPHPVGRLAFDGVPVGRDDVIGEVGGGFRVAMRTLDRFRPSVGAFAVGMSRRALGLAVAHARGRHAFGRPIGDFQAVSHTLAEMATRTEAAAALVARAARLYDDRAAGAAVSDADVTTSAAMAKLFATETAQFVVDAAVQIHGARALVLGHPLEHLYREVRAPRIYEGTSEIQRSVIARRLLTEVPPGAPGGCS